MGEFSGKVAFITGAAHGQGRATALALAKEGANIAAFDVAKKIEYPAYEFGTSDELKSLKEEIEALGSKAAYCYNTAEAGRRALRNLCLAYLLCPGPDSPANAEALQLGKRQYQEADNMTESLAALTAVVNADREAGDALVADFLAKWRHDPLVMDKWLALQAACPLPGTLARVRALLDHPVFDLKNPNKVRALIASFCALNQRQFHAKDGAGYRFLGEMVARLDTFNPQIASRMAAPFTQWKRFDPARQKLMQAQLEQLLQQPKLSDDLKELMEKSLQ